MESINFSVFIPPKSVFCVSNTKICPPSKILIFLWKSDRDTRCISTYFYQQLFLLGCSRSRWESHFRFYALRTYVGFYWLWELVVVHMENRYCVWEQVTSSFRGSYFRAENRYYVRVQVKGEGISLPTTMTTSTTRAMERTTDKAEACSCTPSIPGYTIPYS